MADCSHQIDKVPGRPIGSVLINAAGFVNKDKELMEDLAITAQTPPAYLANNLDDLVDAYHSLLSAAGLKKFG